MLLAVSTTDAAAYVQEDAATGSSFADHLHDQRDAVLSARRDIHRHAEASGEERRTAQTVAAFLESSGFQVRTGVGGYGVVGVLRGASPGPVVAFRADMDAVRSQADDPMDFRSEVSSVNHICGHDIHTAVGLALAAGFGGIRDQLEGSVMLIFQPAEETASGARSMLADGVFEEILPDAVFAYHTAPMDVGQVITAPGALLPGRDAARIEIRGEGDLRPIAEQAQQILEDAATPGSQEPSVPRSEPFVRVDGARTGRGRGDVDWLASATLTTSGRDASASARQAIEEQLIAVGREGVSIELVYRERFVDGIDNDPRLTERSAAVMRSVLGDEGVMMSESSPTQFSEDFGAFQAEVPGVMYFLGVSNSERGWIGMPHTPTYVADENSIFVGAEAMAAVFLDLMAD